MASQAFHNKGTDTLRVPGFGLAICYRISRNKEDDLQCFRHGISDYTGERMTAHELDMLRLMEAITEKPDWHKKIFNDEITSRWSEEAIAEKQSLITDKSFQWCMLELKDKARSYEV